MKGVFNNKPVNNEPITHVLKAPALKLPIHRRTAKSDKSGHKKLPFFTFLVSQELAQFEEFAKRWKEREDFSFCLLYHSKVKRQCEKVKMDITDADEESFTFLPEQQQVLGLSVCWSESELFFMSLQTKKQEKKALIARQWEVVKEVFESQRKKILFDMKSQLKILYFYGIDVRLPLLLVLIVGTRVVDGPSDWIVDDGTGWKQGNDTRFVPTILHLY